MLTSIQTSLSQFGGGVIDFCGTGVILLVATVLCNWIIATLVRRLLGRDPSIDFIAFASSGLFMLIGLLSSSFSIFIAGAAHAFVYWMIRHQRPQHVAPRSEQL